MAWRTAKGRLSGSAGRNGSNVGSASYEEDEEDADVGAAAEAEGVPLVAVPSGCGGSEPRVDGSKTALRSGDGGSSYRRCLFRLTAKAYKSAAARRCATPADGNRRVEPCTNRRTKFRLCMMQFVHALQPSMYLVREKSCIGLSLGCNILRYQLSVHSVPFVRGIGANTQ